MPILPFEIRGSCHALRRKYACTLLAAALVSTGATGSQIPRSATASAPNFATEVAPIFERNCTGCHSSAVHRGGLVLESYESLMKGGIHGQVIVARDANASRLVEMIEGKLGPQMPFNSDPLGRADINVIRSWINAGAIGPLTSPASPTPPSPLIPSLKPQVPVSSPVTSVKFSPDGAALAVGGYREVRLIEIGSSRVLAELPGHADAVRSIAFSPDGTMIAAAGGEPQRAGEIKIWDLRSHQVVKTLNGHKDCIYSIAWSPDGKIIASGSYDKMVKLWDASTGEELHSLQDHIDAVFAVAFSPDGKRLASASQDRTVKIWDIATGRRLYTLSDASDGLTSLAYSPAGDKLTAAGYDKTIYVWQLGEEDGHLLNSLIADEDSVLSILWSHDGRTIVTASSDGSIRFRDSNLDLKGVADRQSDWVEALDLSPNGNWLAAGRYDGTVGLYDSRTYQESRNARIFEELKPTGTEKSREAASR